MTAMLIALIFALICTSFGWWLIIGTKEASDDEETY